MEPAAVLIGAFEIHVRGVTGFIPMRIAQHREVGAAGIEPHVERVPALFIYGTLSSEEFFDRDGLPRFDAALLHPLSHLLQQLRRTRMQRTGFTVQEKRHRYTSLTLPRQRPVRTIGNHAVQPGLPPRGKELSLLDPA